MKLEPLVKELLAPLELEIKPKRKAKDLAYLGALTLTWPITAPIVTFKNVLRGEEEYPNPGRDIREGTIMLAPYFFLKEAFNPEDKYFKIKNPDALMKADDINPRVRLYQDNKGNNICDGLEIIFSDGLYLQIYPELELTSIEKLDLNIDDLVGFVDEDGIKYSKQSPSGIRHRIEPEYSPKSNFLSKVYKDAPSSLVIAPNLKAELDKFV
jgi:hypothetical protein